ncbi:flagellar hook protein FlgE [Acanthopleuribacter pedis]|uniref:Flagellar hook protein FlgE n=1 Tax=Acanthopleuribacter pedis TaxID=442870 RepID=A0A8J7QF68_9BACT|nr:flagellar hook protein FlgE [Acanthopleuribacter pedis]MBO1322939.1 flagellar hook protein FlgE [Acanthopleuribacter pedis]
MLLGSFYTGLSGLNANATALNVIGNNLANINTSGYKRSQTNFSQIMSDTIRGVNGGGNPIQVGLGVRTSEIVAKFEQGSIQTTGIKTNLAIQGEGFFAVSTGSQTAYTRSGNFGFNNQGFLVAASGGRVQGFMGTNPDGTVDTSGGNTDMRIDLGEASPPLATSQVRFVSNLSAEAVNGDTYTSSIEVFDSKGVPHQLSITWTKTPNTGEWTYAFEMPSGTVSPAAPNQGTGVVLFGPDGILQEVDGAPVNTIAANRQILITDLDSGAEDILFSFDLLDIPDPTDLTQNTSFTTSFGSTFNTGTIAQNGFGSGVLQDVDFAQDGTMIGFYNNGLTLELGRVALATFNNKLGLKQIDGGFYFPTAASGPASVDGEGTGGRGTVIASSLESSNVDIAEEFTSLIVHQRGYQSNSRTITTTDQLLQEALNLKR